MGTRPAIAAIEKTFRDAGGEGTIVFDPARLPQATPDWLERAHWGEAAQPVAEGGRGAAWFVSGEFGQAVLRHYRRGGMARHLSTERYLWLGPDRVRSLREFRLMAELHAAGLRVPAPLLAGYRRQGLGYRAAILVERIPAARPLHDWLGEPGARAWEAAGLSIARLHHAGVDHADLNAHNVLLDAEGWAWLIDFDRGRRRPPAAAWREANLARLARSLAKLAGRGADDAWKGGYARLRQAYDDAYRHAGDHAQVQP